MRSKASADLVRSVWDGYGSPNDLAEGEGFDLPELPCGVRVLELEGHFDTTESLDTRPDYMDEFEEHVAQRHTTWGSLLTYRARRRG